MLTLKQLRNDRDIFNQAKMRAGRNNLGVKGAVGVVAGQVSNHAPSTQKEKLAEAELKAIAQDIFLVLGKLFTPVELLNIFGKMVQRGQ